MITAYVTILAVVAWLCFLALVYLGRVVERHHLYWGLLLQLVPWWPAQILGALLVLDELLQHGWQAIRKARGLRPGPDFSPVHRLYVRTITWICEHA